MKSEIIHEDHKDIVETLIAGVREYNRAALGDESPKPLAVVIRNNNNKIIGGVSGRTIYKLFLVDVLWVDETARGQGVARKVMELAEMEAKKRGCLSAQVDTLSIQAPDFYQKLGFEIVGKAVGVSQDHDRYFLLKQYKRN